VNRLALSAPIDKFGGSLTASGGHQTQNGSTKVETSTVGDGGQHGRMLWATAGLPAVARLASNAGGDTSSFAGAGGSWRPLGP
jgi:hypothetical protein